ncbi:MAG: bacillithiol system redox-active protein YtxJ [Phaeodactylibacter sp.]|nr:bacillithiol system redox-active protein YtxJ [Phaeodactylibacter sp.]
MGFLDNIFRQQNADIFPEWKILQTEDQLDALIQDSHAKPVVLFKHSIYCGISARIMHQLEKDWNFNNEELDFYYLDLITFRPISNKIASVTGVVHQSPQVILLQEGQVRYHTSHHMISVTGLREALERA